MLLFTAEAARITELLARWGVLECTAFVLFGFFY
jgi:hypothetical protein